MEATQTLAYDDFILLNDHLSFHPGGLIATFNLLSNISNKSKEQIVLDIGCGNGITIGFLKKLGYKNLIGYDRNQKAIELLQSKQSGFNFFSESDSLLQSVNRVDFLLLESVFNFNDSNELTELQNVIQLLIKEKGVKQIGIVDFFGNGIMPQELIEKMKSTFGIKEIRNKKQFEEIISSFGNNIKVSFFKEHSFFLNLSDKYNPKEQATKLMQNKFLSDSFETETKAQDFFNQFIDDMLKTYSSFTDNFKYFECIVTI